MKKYEGFKRYKVKVWLEEEYYGITAKNEEDAFIQASNLAIDAGCWGREIEEIGDVQVYFLLTISFAILLEFLEEYSILIF